MAEDGRSDESVSCDGEAEYAPVDTVGFKLRFWFGEVFLTHYSQRT